MPSDGSEISLESLSQLLETDDKVKLAGVDVDGQLRGKVVSKKKFLSVAKDGFGFCSVIFGWDMHDMTYFKELKVSNKENGYHDIIAKVDLSSFRRIPWENDVPFFLVTFFDPDSDKPISACPRGLLKTAVDKIHAKGIGAMAGGMLEFRCLLNWLRKLTVNQQLNTNSSNSGSPSLEEILPLQQPSSAITQ